MGSPVDVVYVKTLLGKLGEILQDEYSESARIDAKLKELGANVREDLNLMVSESRGSSEETGVSLDLDEESQEIARLEAGNWKILQRLQRQDYINECYEEVLAKDEDLLALIKASVSTKKNYDMHHKSGYDDLFREKMESLDKEVQLLRSRLEEFESAKAKAKKRIASKARLVDDGEKE
ncbi:unnamed protein product [Kuraishia capsulata CBS 1993]|uniref:Uncharacterized protein n=1 Tax=Kuraishia capsulata CBS 1993 TaxID=1382522 RepID=W6MRJ5_9ASCO|nr:uncharacterized protein KUCA_T00005364001 [Kuraishia capsulata CBS 1993]CDK29376.1 unnamed protein product [Kuraishia capsulata CBS 1993]